MEEGIANIFLVSQHKTVTKAKVEKTVQKNSNKGGSKNASSKNKFFDAVINAVE